MTKEYSNQRVIELIDDYIHNVRDRDILRDNLVDGLSYNELANKYHLTCEGIKKILKKGKIAIFKHY